MDMVCVDNSGPWRRSLTIGRVYRSHNIIRGRTPENDQVVFEDDYGMMQMCNMAKFEPGPWGGEVVACDEVTR